MSKNYALLTCNMISYFLGVEPTVTLRRKRSASIEPDDVPTKKYKLEGMQ